MGLFARRHPYLFSFLVLCFAGCATLVLLVGLLVVAAGSGGLEFGPRVGVIEVEGVISDSQHAVASLARFREDPEIKAVILRVDSPGGAVGPSQEIYREVEKTVAKKPVIVSMGGVAASGGYYVSANANGIMANPATVTGSIGVIIGYTNFEGLFDKVGLSPVVIKSGKFKDMGSPVREMTPEERALFQETVDSIFGQFVSAVAEGRKMDEAKVREIADGRIFTGEQALELGLVDRLGNFRDAVDWAGELGGISGKIRLEVARKRGFSLLEEVLENAETMTRTMASVRPGFSYIMTP